MKALALIGSLATLVLSVDFMRREKIGGFEFPVLILLATLGMMMLISASDFIALYLGLELMSLSLYVVAAYRPRRPARLRGRAQIFRARRALVGHAALRRVADLRLRRHGVVRRRRRRRCTARRSLGVVFGLVFLLAGLAFKISAVPFHMWTPDVYEGAPTPVTAFFAAAPKMAAMAMLVRVVIDAFPGIAGEWRQIDHRSSRSPRWRSAPSPRSARPTSSG